MNGTKRKNSNGAIRHESFDIYRLTLTRLNENVGILASFYRKDNVYSEMKSKRNYKSIIDFLIIDDLFRSIDMGSRMHRGVNVGAEHFLVFTRAVFNAPTVVRRHIGIPLTVVPALPQNILMKAFSSFFTQMIENFTGTVQMVVEEVYLDVRNQTAGSATSL
ncbi:hypothetical protein EVAR_8209_1 [Eumeta japonica]|uniref:Uncharacterized protein n=1 Tax=Eumeta variegata TaxID=151549 RepID=A0A4C1TGE1_EUMVA|nr:hypothetical protein EVAR_8209_1 [Eumeta japonica]